MSVRSLEICDVRSLFFSPQGAKEFQYCHRPLELPLIRLIRVLLPINWDLDFKVRTPRPSRSQCQNTPAYKEALAKQVLFRYSLWTVRETYGSRIQGSGPDGVPGKTLNGFCACDAVQPRHTALSERNTAPVGTERALLAPAYFQHPFIVLTPRWTELLAPPLACTTT